MNLESIDLDISPPEVNFGGGIELLMNDKKKGGTSNSIDLGELSNLENELNKLTEDPKTFSKETEIFNNEKKSFPSMDFNNIKKKEEDINLGEKTANAFQNNKTWDGFGKYKEIPIPSNPENNMTNEEILKEKFNYLRKLEDLERKGANLTKKYTMESSLLEMQGEYEMIISEKEKSNSIKFQGKMLMAAITGLEFLNSKFDPFDIKLDGWSEQLNENIEDYDEIFGELHEKYRSKAKIAPELKLLFQLAGSGIMIHMTNTMFKSSIPGMDDIMKQNPELMQQFTKAAVNSMGESNPGFSNFMNNFMPGQNTNDSGPPPIIPNLGSIPPAVNTQTSKSERFFTPNNRPDIQNSQQPGINIEENFEELNQNSLNPTRLNTQRRNMKGPSDINSLISGLKVKEINVVDKSSQNMEEGSTISIEEIQDLSKEKVPKSIRKPRNSREKKNTVSLDI